MQANWSLILNVLLLIGVVIAIVRMMKTRHHKIELPNDRPSLGQTFSAPQDEVLAVRKVNRDVTLEETSTIPLTLKPLPSVRSTSQPTSSLLKTVIPAVGTFQHEQKAPLKSSEEGKSLMMFLLAKDNRQLVGYELLQTVLAAGLRFGEGQLFHRHQSPNGQGPVLCSLAAATASGVFDMQNIGAFSVRGLCLFMQTSGNPTIDAERFAIMLETAKQLSEDLNTHLLDEQRQPLSDKSIQRYYQSISVAPEDTSVFA